MSKVGTVVGFPCCDDVGLGSDILSIVALFKHGCGMLCGRCARITGVWAGVDLELVIMFFNILGVLPTSFFPTFGPVFGLRQLALSRFYFGWYSVKLCKSPPYSPIPTSATWA